MNFIHKYILPKEVDFNAVILKQASAVSYTHLTLPTSDLV